MSAIRATWHNGQILLDQPADWPDGRRLLVSDDVGPAELEFMTEDEQSDDPAAIERWIEELRNLPPLAMSPDAESELTAWRKRMKEFNLEAMRREMESEAP